MRFAFEIDIITNNCYYCELLKEKLFNDKYNCTNVLKIWSGGNTQQLSSVIYSNPKLFLLMY